MCVCWECVGSDYFAHLHLLPWTLLNYLFFCSPEPMKIPSPPPQSEAARSLPARVNEGVGRPQGPRTPKTPHSKNTPRFYPVMKDTSQLPDPQVCIINYALCLWRLKKWNLVLICPEAVLCLNNFLHRFWCRFFCSCLQTFFWRFNRTPTLEVKELFTCSKYPAFSLHANPLKRRYLCTIGGKLCKQEPKKSDKFYRFLF